MVVMRGVLAGIGVALAGWPLGVSLPVRFAAPTSASAATATAPDPARARALVERAKAAKKMASDALDVDGTETAARGLDQVLSCRLPKLECNSMALAISDPNARVGALVARTVQLANEVLQPNISAAKIVSLEPRVVDAERYAHQAYDQAKKNGADRAERQRKMDAEAQSVAAATLACGSNEGACSARCDKGEAAMCLAYAVRLRNAKPPKLDDARKYLDKGCALQSLHACAEINGIDEQIKREDEKNRAWNDVRAIGDDLAKNDYHHTFGLRNAMSESSAMAMLQMGMYVRALAAEQYCPAKAEFLARASEAEFEQRAADHCADDPPTSNAITGVTVTLTEQCKAAFAIPCADPPHDPRQ